LNVRVALPCWPEIGHSQDWAMDMESSLRTG